jgi:glycoside/pentoside/hexuronide:cation symporter, GPH family
MSTTSASDRIPLPQKVGFGLGAFIDMWGHWLYQSLAFQVFNLGLGVAPGLISTVLGLKIFVDAIFDVLFGWLSDNSRSRWGRRRPFILVGGVLAGIGLPLMFAVERGWSDTQYFWFMLISTTLYVPVMSCFNMPWISLGAEMTPGYHERTHLMSVKNAIQKIPELAMFVAAQFTTLAIFNNSEGKPDIVRGAQAYTSILGIIMVALSVAIFLLTRERYYEALVVKHDNKVPLKDTLYRTLANGQFRKLLGMTLAYMVATSMVGTLGYYATVFFVCKGDLAKAGEWNSMMGLSGMAFGLAGIAFAGQIAKRWGKRNTLIVVLLLAIAAFIGDWFFYNPELPALQLLASGCVAFTGGGFWTIFGSSMGDVMDHDELSSGLRREGAFSACQSWITKVGLALGNGASGWILHFTGFDAKLPVQGEQAIFLIRVLLSGIPVVGLLIALMFIWRYSLTEQRMHEIRLALESRRGAV